MCQESFTGLKHPSFFKWSCKPPIHAEKALLFIRLGLVYWCLFQLDMNRNPTRVVTACPPQTAACEARRLRGSWPGLRGSCQGLRSSWPELRNSCPRLRGSWPRLRSPKHPAASRSLRRRQGNATCPCTALHFRSNFTEASPCVERFCSISARYLRDHSSLYRAYPPPTVTQTVALSRSPRNTSCTDSGRAEKANLFCHVLYLRHPVCQRSDKKRGFVFLLPLDTATRPWRDNRRRKSAFLPALAHWAKQGLLLRAAAAETGGKRSARAADTAREGGKHRGPRKAWGWGLEWGWGTDRSTDGGTDRTCSGRPPPFPPPLPQQPASPRTPASPLDALQVQRGQSEGSALPS